MSTMKGGGHAACGTVAVAVIVAVQQRSQKCLPRAVMATESRDAFGVLLRAYRKRVGLTQIQLADFSTVSVRAIRDLEVSRAHRPRLGTVRLLADGLRLSGEQRAELEVAAGQDAVSAALHAFYGEQPIFPPTPRGPLLGRESEARRLYDLIASGPDRFVTILGMAGVGKTRLLLAVARDLHQRIRMPVMWVPPVLGQAIPADYGLADQPAPALISWLREAFSSSGEGVDEFASFISDRPFLLVLDGQHIGQMLADLLAGLLVRCPGLRIVSTTQACALQPTQRMFPLRPLAVAPHDGIDKTRMLRSDPAAELVLWHIRHLQPEREVTANESAAITRLCWWLDGIPLALESAAAWVLIVSPARLVDTARRNPFTVAESPSQSGSDDWLRGSLSHAVAALSQLQRRLLTALSRREAPWSLEDVAAHIGGPISDAAFELHGLIFHNLVRSVEAEGDSPGMFTVLNTVRHLVLSLNELAVK
jgi:transcriptional regulator with XRE-family HTH domain